MKPIIQITGAVATLIITVVGTVLFLLATFATCMNEDIPFSFDDEDIIDI